MARQFWIYKNRKKGESYGHEGLWENFFDDDTVKDWSDPTMRIITWGSGVDPQAGDFVFAQQSDHPRRIVGTAEIVSVGAFRTDLALKPQVPFTKEVPLPSRRELAPIAPEVAKIRAMARISGSLFLLSPKEASTLARFCGWKSTSFAATPSKRKMERVLSAAGGGFGNPAENRKIEQAAIRASIKYMKTRGWKLFSDVQNECLGYDLVFCSRGASIHVEVKGVRGTSLSFFLTANEERCMRADPAWQLCVVTLAGTPSPKVKVFDARQVASRFSSKPALFKLSERRTV